MRDFTSQLQCLESTSLVSCFHFFWSTGRCQVGERHKGLQSDTTAPNNSLRMCYQWNEGPQIVHQPIPIQRLHLGVAYLACIYANLHSHSECFLAHRMVKNDQYTAGISQLIWRKKSKETDFWDKSLTLKSTGWMESEPYFLVGWIGLLRTASYYTILAVCCILMQWFHNKIPPIPHNIQHHSHSPTTALAKPGSQMAESCNLLLGESWDAKTFFFGIN